MKKFDKAVVIGRFQPFHNGHAAMVRKALEEAKSVTSFWVQHMLTLTF